MPSLAARGLLVACAAVALLSGDRARATTRQVSVASGGEPAFCGAPENFCYSIQAAISEDARFVSFSSVAPNLVPGLQNGFQQLYLHDRLTCTTIRISESQFGEPGEGNSTSSSVSADGEFVAFQSTATNLVPGTTDQQIFVYDRITDQIELISANEEGLAGNGTSAAATISADGRYVCFMSNATDLVPGLVDDNNAFDIFVRDRALGTTVCVSVDSNGAVGDNHSRRSRISDNGRFVVFDSAASNLSTPATPFISMYLHDRDANETGVFDEPGGTTTIEISVNSDGEPANDNVWWGDVSDDGRKVVYYSRATNLAPDITNGVDDIFLRDPLTGETTRESVGPNGAQARLASYMPRLTPDGHYLVFHSAAPQLVAGGNNGFTHIIRRDLTTGENIIVSRNFEGELADSSSEDGAITANGQTIAFASAAGNLAPENVNPWVDVFVQLLQPTDVDRSGSLDLRDVALLQTSWPAPCSVADINGDGVVDGADLALFFADYE